MTLPTLTTNPLFNLPSLDFTLPPELEATAPAEARGSTRDGVRLMVSERATNAITHTRFDQLDRHVRPGDVLVINTSGTLPAALPGHRADGQPIRVHLSTHLPGDIWLIELRQLTHKSTAPLRSAQSGERIALPAGGAATLLAPYQADRSQPLDPAAGVRLWMATLALPEPLLDYLHHYGAPIRYSYVQQEWPLAAYQTVYATEPGSAEMPSAGRAFTPELITRLVAQGVHFAPLLLHTGVASLEDHEPPYEECYSVSAATAQTINSARAAGGRIIAVGTTAIRALETVTSAAGVVHPGAGWTRLVITPQRQLRAVDGLITGLHEPRATHLAMLAALAGFEHLQLTYAAALHKRYLWHEFGDLHLILP